MKRLAEVAPKVAKLLEGILPRQARVFAVGDVPMPVAAMAASLLGEGRTLLVTPSPETADQALADAAALLPGVPLLPLAPADDEEALLTGGRMAQVRDILAAQGHCLIVASVHALLQPAPDPKALDRASLSLRLNADFPFDTLAGALTGLGYTREELVTEPLTFALRGGILDVWPAGAAQPVRAEFFGDTVDGLRAFDPATQCSVARLERLSLPPAPSAKIKSAQLLPQLKGASLWVQDAPAVEAALAQLPLVSQRQANAEWLAVQAGALGGRVCWAGEPLRGGMPAVALVAEPIRGVRDLAGNGRANHPDFYAGLRKTLLTELDAEARRRRTVLVCAEGAAARELLARELPPDTKVKLLPESLSEGFTLANLRLTVAAQGDLYPTTRSWRAAPRAKPIAGQRLEYAFDVEPGELVVHLGTAAARRSSRWSTPAARGSMCRRPTRTCCRATSARTAARSSSTPSTANAGATRRRPPSAASRTSPPASSRPKPAAA